MSTLKTNLSWLLKLTLNIFVCWSLCLIPMQSTYADSVLQGSGSQTNTPATSGNTGNSGGELDRLDQSEQDDGVLKVEGNEVKAAGKFLFSNIALFAAGFMAPTLLKSCFNKTSVKIFAASGVLYIANEIGLFTGFNKSINREMVAYLNRGDEDKQIESLETAAKQTRKAKNAAKRRATIAKIAATGFLAATVMAGVEAYREANPVDGEAKQPCTGPMAFNNPNIGDGPIRLYAQNIQEDSFQQTFLSSNQLPLKQLSIVEYLENYQDFNYSAQRNSLIEKIMSKVLIKSAHAAEEVGTDRDAKVVKDGKTGEQKIVVNSVGAKLAATGLGAIGGMIVMKQLVANELTMPKMLKTGIARTVAFGAFSVTALGAAKESDDAANKLEERAQEYDRLANTLRNQISQDIENGSSGSQFIDQSVQTVEQDQGALIGNNEVCGTGKGLAPNFTTDCSCSKTNSCFQPPLPDTSALPAFSGSPILADSIKSLKATSGDVFAGRLKSANTNAQKLTSGAARITKLRDALQKKINEDRLKKGGNEIDFEKAQNAFNNQFERSLASAFNKLTPKEQATLNNLTGGYIGNTDEDKKKGEKDDLAEDSSVDVGAKAVADVNPNPGTAKKTADGGVWDFNFEDDAKAANAEQAAIDAALKANEDENYVVDGDINDDRNKNLFNIITKRYLKSAYPVIFEEK